MKNSIVNIVNIINIKTLLKYIKMDKYIKEKEHLLTDEEKNILSQCDIIKERVNEREDKIEAEKDAEIKKQIMALMQMHVIKNDVLEMEIISAKDHLEQLTNKKRSLDKDYETLCEHKYKKKRDTSYLHNNVKCFYCDKVYEGCKCTNCDW